MARILIMTHGRVAMVHSIAALAAQLSEAGHEVVYSSPDPMGPRTRVAGLPCEPLPPNLLADAGAAATRQDRSASRPRPRIASETLGVSTLPEIVERIDPDLLLIDIELHAHILRCLSLEVPMGLLSPFISINKRFGLPPLHSTVVPGRGWRGTALYAEWLWARFRVRKRLRGWLGRAKPGGHDQISLLRAVARESGTNLRAETTPWQWLIPFSYRRLPVLSLTASELDFSTPETPGTLYCGAMVQRHRGDEPLPADAHARLQAIYERRRSGVSRSLILCSLSTFLAADPGFVARIAEAVGAEPDWELVLATGGQIDLEAVGALPDNVHLFAWIPQMEVLAVADCAIINAGTSIFECIHHGVPMVVYSLQFNDQNGNAARVEFHGLGIVGDKENDQAPTVRAHIHRVLEDASFGEKVDRMRHKLAAYDAEARATRAVESLLPPKASAGK